MYKLHCQTDNIDPSTLDVNKRFVESVIVSRPCKKTPKYNQLLSALNDQYLAEIIWAFYREKSIDLLDSPLKALNFDHKWWEFWKTKNTIRSLLKTYEGKQRIWQMLHDASAWL
jgi:hypothetical protein